MEHPNCYSKLADNRVFFSGSRERNGVRGEYNAQGFRLASTSLSRVSSPESILSTRGAGHDPTREKTLISVGVASAPNRGWCQSWDAARKYTLAAMDKRWLLQVH